MNAKTEVATKEESNIVQHPASQEEAVMGMLQTALEKGVDADSLEKLLNMQERILDRQAEQAYSISMMNVQNTMPTIEKNKDNSQTNSKYANLEIIIKTITPIYTAEGISLSFGTEQSPFEQCVRVTCDVMHREGHSKHYFYDSPFDMYGIKGNQNKTAAHGSASAISYGRRYLTAMIFNLNTGDDDDGQQAGQSEMERMSNELERYKFINKSIIEHCGVINVIKYGIEIEMLADAAESWFNLSDDEKKALWIAPTKGGPFTTAEREVIKSREFRIAHFGEDDAEQAEV